MGVGRVLESFINARLFEVNKYARVVGVGAMLVVAG